MKKLVLIVVLMHSFLIKASELPSISTLESDQVLPNFEKKKKEGDYLPGNSVIPHFEIKDKELLEVVEKARLKMKDILSGNLDALKEDKKEVADTAKTDEQVVDEVTVAQSAVEKEIPQPPKPKKPKKKRRRYLPKPKPKSGIKIFHANLKYLRSSKVLGKTKSVTIPSGATTLATIKYGFEVPSPEDEVSARIDAHFAGPNETYVMMKSCVTWIKLQHHYSTRKVYGKTEKLSCRAPNGKTFEVPFKAKIINTKDEYAGMIGKLQLNGKLEAALFGFGNAVTTEFGKAMSAVAQTKSVVPGNDSQQSFESTNITGNSDKYITGKILESAGSFLDWHTKFYQSMTPTLAVPPGTKVFLEVRDTAFVPKSFFTSKSLKVAERNRNLNTTGFHSMESENEKGKKNK